MTKVTSEQNPSSAPWYESAFGEDYLKIYGHRSPEAAAREARWLIKTLGLSSKNLVLDAACGNGRHVAALQSLGIPTIGADLSGELLSASRDLFGALPLARHDVRALPFGKGTFSHIMLLFTSFGYFHSDQEHVAALREIQQALSSGGTFVLDFLNATRTIESLAPETTRTVGDLTIIERREYDKKTGRIDKTIKVASSEVNGADRVRHYRESVRAYTEVELRSLLIEAGFRLDARHGDFDDAPYSASSSRLILISRAA